MPRQSLEKLMNLKAGIVSRTIFFSEEIYRRELECVFARCWLYLGHESQIPQPGDYITNYMGEDPVIVCRDARGRIQAFLNSCRHRGMKVCRADGGNASFFRCSFHGWTYSNEGQLIGVPYHKEGYFGELEREQWGLKKVSRVASYGGFIFGCWDESATNLDEYLGDLRWYLDILLERPLGGLEVIPGQQRYVIAANWKIAGENFAGDTYHLPYSHGSIYRLPARRINPVTWDSGTPMYSVALDHGHGVTQIAANGERYRADLDLAREMGPDVVEYVEEGHRRLQERVSPRQVDVYALAFGNVFPNFSFNVFSALRPLGLYLWHPKGPGKLEAWQWCAVDRQAPKAVKDLMRVDFTRTQAVSGLASQDDSENFEQVTEATRGIVGQTLDFNYQMGLGHEGEMQIDGCPGRFGAYYSELCQRNFYSYWAELMDEL
jgi:phenylpropionate dioxygenase-like ring-hydroxylating dioxygenase large terminal subunit